MKSVLEFSITSLLSSDGIGISAPMSPMLFARDVAKAAGFKFNRLARIHFVDPEVLQNNEEGRPTAYDTVIIACKYPNDLYLSLWVDTGTAGIPVAECYQSDGVVMPTEVYENEGNFLRKLTTGELREVFDFIFRNPAVLDLWRTQKDK
jgi:hypothetical protein